MERAEEYFVSRFLYLRNEENSSGDGGRWISNVCLDEDRENRIFLLFSGIGSPMRPVPLIRTYEKQR